MKLFADKQERQPAQYSMRHGPPIDGPRSALAGIAEPGDRLDVLGWGSYRNEGSKAAPRWVRLNEAPPASSSGDWRKLPGDDAC
jgi:hypothetical protein